MRPLRVFLCHASQDKPAVRGLYKRLSKEKWIDPWLDEEKLSFGQHWTTVIEDALDAADVVLIFLSHNSVNKEGFVQRELNYAWELSLEKPRGVIYLIPFRLDDCEIPRFLRSRQWGDYFGNKEETTYQILLRSLKQRYEQKMNLETEEIANKDFLDQLAKGEEERETGTLEKEKLEKKAKLFREEKWRRVRERETNENAKRYDREKRIGKIIDRVFNWFSANFRWFGIGGLLLLITFIFGGFGLNYLIKNLPVSTDTISSSIETPISTPTLGVGSTMVSEKDGMILVYVPDGEFTMGSNDGLLDEMPVHQLYLDAFWIDNTEVTNKQYSVCVAAGMCESPVQTESLTRSNYFGDARFDNYPVISVDWKRAKNYCEWANRRLPTEAEWEKAARGTNGYIYPWGRKLPNSNLLNYNDEVGDTVEVGQYPDGASVYGAFDMAGNVLEWVSSLYQPYPYTIYNGRENMGSLDARVLRGGSLNLGDYHVRTTYRIKSNPAISSEVIGFRCAISP